MMQLVEFFLAQNWTVTFASAAAPSNQMADLDSLGVRKATIELNNSSFDKQIRQLAPDLVLFDRFMLEEQFGWRVAKHCPDALRLLDTEDLHCLRNARHQALKANRKISIEDLNSEMAIREVAAILRCDLSLVISQYEMGLLTDHYGVSPDLLLHLPFMLPNISSETFTPFKQRTGYISIGNFRHAPNWDAVLHLKNAIWPLIRARHPQARLHVYGAYPPPKATQLHNPRQGFLVEGWAEDAHQVMSQARVCLAPLRFGAGLKGKLIDAMRSGTPNVTTSIGAESMHGNLPWSGAIEDDPQQFADAAVRLYQDLEQWQQAQDNGREIINRCYKKDLLGKKLLSRLNELRRTLTAHRLNNFTGAMLQHHTMQSTRYMAQWIEAKSRPN
jgi:glycosyltransferase involved in cell wall biosynthesis